MSNKIFVAAAIALLSGCGGNVKSVHCKGLNWSQQGYEAAQSGKSVREFDQFRNQCGERLEAGAMNAYVDGYTTGIREYCTYDNGYEQGYTKKVMGDFCPSELREAYEKGFRAGKFALQSRIENARNMGEGKGMSEDVEEMEIFKGGQ